MNILIINGPNLNLLGIREKTHYGSKSLETVNKELSHFANTQNSKIEFFQSNSESDIIEKIHDSKHNYIIANLGAYTHTSIAIRDAFLGTKKKFIEVHISNIYKRDEFRHKSLFSDISEGVIVGMGTDGYKLALYHLLILN